MTRWTAVSRQQHANARWKPRKGFEFARPLQVVDVLIPELSKLLPHYALAFIQRDGNWQPVALLGIGGEKNLYVDADGKWLGRYVPAALRGYPFTLAAREDGDKVLCLNEAHLATEGTSEDGTQPLFHGEELAEPTARTLGFLKQCDQARTGTAAATKALADADLFQPWPLKVNRGEEKEPLTLDGLHHINEQRLNELDAETFAGLRRAGALLLAYSQLLSMVQTEQLGQRAEHLGAQAKARTATDDLGSLFDDSGSLNFDNLEDQ
ncbi:MAG: SapC family protein [Pseudohongiellaceae bacterium]